ncbi:MAG TPA: class I SAM-dependent methyltransferase [Candidatus Angelobacter sp.]
MALPTQHATPVPGATSVSGVPAGGQERFAFGRNWQKFLSSVSEERIAVAQESLSSMLQVTSLAGKSFLDIGTGSGLFSLAAIRLGATRVHSFDFDHESVACARQLKARYFAQAPNWVIEQGSALDEAYLSALGTFDVVYAWGVLHHTGSLFQALENTCRRVAPGGKLFVAVYNDEGLRSRLWRAVKVRYCRSLAWRLPIVLGFGSYFSAKGLVKDLALLRNPFSRYRSYKTQRGMSYFTDLLDWLGGFPFEVAKPGDVIDACCARGFVLTKLKTPLQPKGNNEYVFARIEPR